jgi:hypothetical protein
MTGCATSAAAGAVALTRALTLRIESRTLAIALTIALAVALAYAAAIAATGQTGRLALSHDLPGVDVHVTGAFALSLGLEVGRTLRWGDANLNLHTLAQNRVNLRGDGSTGRLHPRSGFGTLRRHLGWVQTKIGSHAHARVERQRLHLHRDVDQALCRCHETANLGIGPSIGGELHGQWVGITGQLRARRPGARKLPTLATCEGNHTRSVQAKCASPYWFHLVLLNRS